MIDPATPEIAVVSGFSYVHSRLGDYLVAALTSMGHPGVLIDTNRLVARGRGPAGAREVLQWTLSRIDQLRPHTCVVLDSVMDVEHADVLKVLAAQLSKRGVTSCFWFVDDYRKFPLWPRYLPYFGAVFHIQGGRFNQLLEEAGCRVHAHVPMACNPRVHWPCVGNGEFSVDMSFAGKPYPNRVALMKLLSRHKIAVAGPGWLDTGLPKDAVLSSGVFSEDDFRTLVANTKINLSIHMSFPGSLLDSGNDAISPRVFELAACGGFQLSDSPCGIEPLFDASTEIPVFQSVDQLLDLAGFYLARPEERSRLAQAARRKALSAHTYEHRASLMLQTLETV